MSKWRNEVVYIYKNGAELFEAVFVYLCKNMLHIEMCCRLEVWCLFIIKLIKWGEFWLFEKILCPPPP